MHTYVSGYTAMNMCVYVCTCVCVYVHSVCHQQMICVYLVCVVARMCLVRILDNTLWLYLACVSIFSVCHRKLYACVHRVFMYLVCVVETYTYQYWSKGAPPGGVFNFVWFPNEEPGGRGPPWKTIHKIDQFWGFFFQGDHYKVCIVVRVYLVYVKENGHLCLVCMHVFSVCHRTPNVCIWCATIEQAMCVCSVHHRMYAFGVCHTSPVLA